MHLNFRQGLISFQQSGPQALFLVPSTKAGCVDISVTPTPLIGTIAHGSSDYLLQFDATIPAAFGPLIADSDNYLYIELNVLTGLTVYGISLLEPKTSSIEPTGAVPGQMWFDLTTTVMKVRSNDGLKWLVSPRLVIGKVRNGNINQIIPALVGTSVGLNVSGHPGFLMLDSLLRPLRTSSGELLTSDSAVRVKTTVGTAGVLALPTNGFVSVRANEAIPAMSLVYFSGPDSVSLASSNPALTVPKAPLGVCQQDLAQNEVGTITQAGEITSDQFNWSDAECGLPLYCGWNGEITKTRPQGLQAYRVGYIKNSKTILFYVDSETELQILSTAGSIISGTPPITAVTVMNRINEIITTISMSEASANSDGYMTSSQAQLVSTFDGRTSQNEAAIIGLQASKASIVHSHVVPDVSGLQAILDGKSDIGHLHPEYALVLHTHPEYALLQHVHFISEVTGLQAALNNKSDITHTHLIADTAGLQIALDSKAFANHTHTIGNVSGLQANLDSKAPLIHTHVIADVTGLQAILDGKSDIGHTHTLASSLTDVLITSPISNDTLAFNGTQWVNVSAPKPISRNISASGDAVWAVNFDGTADVTGALTLATVFTTLNPDNLWSRATINNKGLVTDTTPITASDITSALGFVPLNSTGDTLTGALNIKQVNLDTTVTIVTSDTSTIIDTFSSYTFRSAKYLVQVHDTSMNTFHFVEMHVIHDGTTAFKVEFGEITSAGSLGTFDASIVMGDLILSFTPSAATTKTVTVYRTAIALFSNLT